MRTCLSFLVSACAVLVASPVWAQDIARTATVVGFSGDSKVALVRWTEHFEGEDVDEIAVARFDLSSGKVQKKHSVVSRKEIQDATKDGAIDAKAVTRLRGQRWTELEKQLKKEGFSVDPKYPELKRTGPEVGHASFELPGGGKLEEKCEPTVPPVVGEDLESCKLVASRGDKSAVVVEKLFKNQMPSPMMMDFLAKAYLDPKGRYLITVARHTTLGSEFGGDPKDLSAGLRALDFQKIESQLK